jgi:hypothetical protein
MRRAKDPSVSDFHRDMNEHPQANYKKVGGSFVVELDSMISNWRLIIWKAVKDPIREGYVVPDISGNRYVWDAVAEGEYEDKANAQVAYDGITGEGDVQEYSDSHPYDGPRPSYHERAGNAWPMIEDP